MLKNTHRHDFMSENIERKCWPTARGEKQESGSAMEAGEETRKPGGKSVTMAEMEDSGRSLHPDVFGFR